MQIWQWGQIRIWNWSAQTIPDSCVIKQSLCKVDNMMVVLAAAMYCTIKCNVCAVSRGWVQGTLWVKTWVHYGPLLYICYFLHRPQNLIVLPGTWTPTFHLYYLHKKVMFLRQFVCLSVDRIQQIIMNDLVQNLIGCKARAQEWMTLGRAYTQPKIVCSGVMELQYMYVLYCVSLK